MKATQANELSKKSKQEIQDKKVKEYLEWEKGHKKEVKKKLDEAQRRVKGMYPELMEEIVAKAKKGETSVELVGNWDRSSLMRKYVIDALTKDGYTATVENENYSPYIEVSW